MKTFVELVTEIKKSFDQEDNKVLTNIEDSVEKTSVATAVHTEGSYLIYNKTLYKVIDDIAIGDTLVISPATGANIELANDIITQLLSKEDGATILVQTLAVGNTTLTFSDASILTTSDIDIYSDPYGIVPLTATATNGQCVLTFDAQESAVSIKLKIRN